MGQQQLLLIVLGVIIVGVAIVAGMGLFQAGAEESVKDELVSQCMAIAANAQQYYSKPEAMGGGGGDFDEYEIPEKLSATTNCGSITYDAEGDATYTAGYTADASGQSFVITATPNTNLDYSWIVTCTVHSNRIETSISDN